MSNKQLAFSHKQEAIRLPRRFGDFSYVGTYCLLLIAYCLLLSCSLPNLEDPDCTKARDVVREFYSFHFGNDMHPSKENIQLREKYLTRDYAGRLSLKLESEPQGTKDYFTNEQDFPKAFRVGECKVVEPGKMVRFEILLFWKNDTTSEQKHISASVKKENETWLIDDVAPLDK